LSGIGSGERRGALSFYALAWVFYLILAVAGLAGWALARGTLGLDAFVEPGTWWIDLGLGVVFGAGMLGAWEILRRLAPGARRVEAEIRRLLGPLSTSEALSLAVMSALAEEVAFRGALQSWLGWVPAALLFGLAHLGPGRPFRWWTLWALGGGLALGLLVVERGAIGGAIVAHLLVNGIQLQRLRHPA
jgi:membrane protease YdiL (CAAX protease family)